MIWFALLILVAALSAAGQILFKLAALGDASLLRKISDRRFMTGALLFLVCPVLTIWALHHVEYSKFYATTALNYVFVLLGSRFALQEQLDSRKIIGTLLILFGLVAYML